MDEVRAPDKEQIKKEYLKGVKPMEISKKYDISINTLKSWIKRYGWSNDKKMQGAPSHKKGAPLKNKNSVGHASSVPEGNKNAERHGFFAKWLPPETAEIMQSIQHSDPLDLLWDNIQLQYTAIVRAQKLMYVKDQEDKTIEKVGEGFGNIDSEKWEVQQAWDKHATFLKAQSRAMGELRSMIKQYDELLHNNWELATEEQKQRISLIKAQTDKLSGTDNKDELQKLDEVLAEIKGVV
jgi:uncharacterized protein YjcR